MAKKMDTKKTFSLKGIVFIFILIATFLLSNAFVRKEIKSFTRKIEDAGKVLKSKKDHIESLLVEVQKLSSEERIVRIAQDSLGLIRTSEEFDKIKINEQQVKQIEKIVNSEYD